VPAMDLIGGGLLALWAALLFGGFLLGSDPGRRRRMPRWTRLGSSAVLVALAWYGYGLAALPPVRGFALFIALGMTGGFLGDLYMARVLPSTSRVLSGMTAFGLGHGAYILAAWLRLGRLPWAFLVLAWLLAGGLVRRVVFRHAPPGILRWAALGYGLLLATTAGMAAALAWDAPPFWIFAVGSGLFLVSDLILAGQLFGELDFPYVDDLVWLLYGPGQAGMVLSIWAAMAPG